MRKYFSLLILCVWVALVFILSFQNGTETAHTSHEFTTQILRFLMGEEPAGEMVATWDMRFRLYAHVGIFLIYGVISLMVLLDWMKGTGLPLVLSAISGVGFAVLSEVGKLRIEGRHCDMEEMMLNIAGALFGTIFWYVLVKLGQSVRAKRLAFVTGLLVLLGVALVNTSTTSYAYTDEQIQQAKAWLSAHGYSADMGGASAAYQDYLNGKFDEELGMDVNGDGIPAASTEATDAASAVAENGTESASAQGTETGNTEQNTEIVDTTVSSEANSAGADLQSQGTDAVTTEVRTTMEMTTELSEEASTEETTEVEEMTTETMESTEEADAEDESSMPRISIVLLIILVLIAVIFVVVRVVSKSKHMSE